MMKMIQNETVWFLLSEQGKESSANGLSWILENAEKQRNLEWKHSISALWRLLSYLLPSSLVQKQDSYFKKHINERVS